MNFEEFLGENKFVHTQHSKTAGSHFHKATMHPAGSPERNFHRAMASAHHINHYQTPGHEHPYHLEQHKEEFAKHIKKVKDPDHLAQIKKVTDHK